MILDVFNFLSLSIIFLNSNNDTIWTYLFIRLLMNILERGRYSMILLEKTFWIILVNLSAPPFCFLEDKFLSL